MSPKISSATARVRFILLPVLPLLVVQWGCRDVVPPGDDNASTPPAVVNYELALTRTPAGEFGPLGQGQEQEVLDSPEFGPDVGYPQPEMTLTQDLGLFERGDFITIDASNGDLSGTQATIDQEPVSIDPDSSATHIGVEIPFTLAKGTHTLQLRDPTGDILIADITFLLENPILGR